jgi:serine/threonine-protein kinase
MLPPVRVGDVFEGKWRILSKLGAGGMGSVFLAHDLALDRQVAVKVLARELCLDAQFVVRFEREARLTAKLEHPNVVPVYAVGRHMGRPFMVMKKLDGDTLAWHMQAQGKLEPARTLDIMRQLCAGLSHIHAHGCVHRDIKAGNVFISPAWLATILDFGVLRDPNSGGNTQAGMMLGTPRYMSPEQARGAMEVDLRADLYALGVLLFECLCGRAPFEGASDLAVIHMHAQQEPPEIIALDPTLPPAIGPMLRKALAKAPDGRYQTADEFYAALDGALTESGEPPAPAPVPGPEDPQAFDPSAVPEATEAPPEPEPVEPPATTPSPEPQPAPGSPRQRRRWFWPAVTVVSLLLAAGNLYYLRWDHPSTVVDEPSRPVQPDPKPQPDKTPTPPVGPVKQVKLYGTLKVASVLSGKPYPATVEVDGQEKGDTPVTVELVTGKHLVKVSRTGFQTWEKEVVIAHRKALEVKVDMLP